MRKRLRAAVLCASVALATALSITSCGNDDEEPPASQNMLTIGALLSLTGSWSSLGQNSQAALTFGVADVNAYLAGLGSPLRVALQVEDTKLDPNLALAELQQLASAGITVVVGPQSSAEVAALKPFADSHGEVLISQGSTAHSLAIAGDNILRLCPDDVQEGLAVSALMLHDGKQVIIPMTRDDPGNQGLQGSAAAVLAPEGATVLPVLSYPADTGDFVPVVQALATQVEASLAQHAAETVAVYLTAFDEATAIFDLAAQNSTLASVQWYGSDGVAGSAALLGDTTAAAFAAHVVFPCPIFGLDPAAMDKWAPLSDRVHEQTGLVPDAFALSTYDAVWVATLATLAVGRVADAATFQSAFTQTASTYFGATGSMELNAAGDRSTGTFDFQGICPRGTNYGWRSVGTFTPAGGSLGVIFPRPCAP